MADDWKVKTKFWINDVKAPISCRIEAVPSKKGKDLVFLSSGDTFVYLFESSRILNIFSFPGCVRYFLVDGQYCLAITEDGKVWRVPFSRHKVKASSKPNFTQTSNSDLPTNQVIFSDLLSNDTKQQHAEDKPSVHVTEITANNAILCEPNVSVILPYKGFLITVATSEQESSVSFYEQCTQLSYNPVPTHRKFLEDAGGSFSFPACLLVIRENGNSGDNILQRAIFDALKPKGSEDDAVLLLGSLEGRVWSLSTSPLIMKNSPELVWDLEEPICYLSLTTLSADSKSDNLSNAVIVISRRGKCVIFYYHHTEFTHSEHNLSGPIICCLNYLNYIFYSNGKELCMAKLSLVKDGDSSNVVLLTTYFNIANIAAMCPLKLSSSTPDRCYLEMLTLNGKVMDVSLPYDDAKAISSLQSKQGNHLKDLLFSIENIAMQSKTLREDLDIVEKVLKQLNQDITLLFNLNSSLKPSEFLKWTVSPGYAASTDSYHITLKLQNLTRILIRDNWSFLIQIRGLSSEKDFSSRRVTSHSLNIGNLAYGITKEFCVSLLSNYDLKTCLAVEAHVCYNLKSLLCKLPKCLQHVTDCVLVSLGHTNIDILHFVASLCKVGDSGFDMSIRRSQLDELESFCQIASGSGQTGLSVTVSSLKTIRFPIAKDVFMSIRKPIKPALILTNHDLQFLYDMMSYTDDVLEVSREGSETSQRQHDLDGRSVNIRLESASREMVIVLEAPSGLELYALVEAFASRVMVGILDFLREHASKVNQNSLYSLPSRPDLGGSGIVFPSLFRRVSYHGV